MNNDNQKLESLMKNTARTVNPGIIFGLKMRFRLAKKSVGMFWHRTKFTFKVATASTLLLIMIFGGVGTYAYTSPQVNASSMLYPIKRSIEDIEVGLSFSPEAKVRAHMKMARRRMDEVEFLQKHFSNLKDHEKANLNKTFDLMEKRMDRALDTIPVTAQDNKKRLKLLHDIESDCGRLRTRAIHINGLSRAEKMTEFTKKRLNRIHTMQNGLMPQSR